MYLPGGLFILTLHSGVLSREVLVEAVERVYLEHIATDDGAASGQLFLQSGYLPGIVGLDALQLLQQFLRAHLLLGELGDDRVVVDLRFHLAVLACELLVFVLHFLLVELCQFLHVLVHFLLVVETFI